MALKLYERYPQLWESPSNDYPQGAFKNLSAQGETDGSYLEKDWLNDYSGFFGALLRNAEMTPDGTIDTAQRSQFYDALIKVAKKSVTDALNKKRDISDYRFEDLVYIDSNPHGAFLAFYGEDKAGIFVLSGDRVAIFGEENIKGGNLAFTSELPIISQSTGSSTTSVMSEKAVTDHILLESTPIGTVQSYIGEIAPNDKWLLCRGQAFSTESYPDLALLLPDLKIPDLRGVALRGLDANRGFDPNRELLSYQEDAMQKIEGSFQKGGVPGNITSGAFVGSGTVDGFRGELAAGYGTPVMFDSSRVTRTNTQNETVMKNVAVNFIIKAR